MCKLCLGTFFTAITVCVDENSFKQGEDFRNIFGLIDPDYDPSPDLVSKFVRGVRTPSKAFISAVNRYEPDQYEELSFCMNDISNKFNAQSEELLTKTITKIVKGDTTIPDNEIVDLVNGTIKNDLPGDYKDLSSFLTGVFLYVIKYVKNDKMNEYVKQIDKLFIAEFNDLTQYTAKDTNVVEVRTETEELNVRRFLLNHEMEKSLMPLCQIAYAYNPNQKYIRTLYTEYNLLTKGARKRILEQCDSSKLIEIEELQWQEGLLLFCNDLIKYNLTSERYLYVFSQYFPDSYRYASYRVDKYVDNSFKRIIVPDISSRFMISECCTLDKYIEDYLVILERGKNIDVERPLDYLWKNLNLSSCSEEDIVFWLCRFIIDVCNNLSIRIVGKPIYADCYDDSAETIEDLFFSAIYALHKHYHFHQKDCMEMDIRL